MMMKFLILTHVLVATTTVSAQSILKAKAGLGVVDRALPTVQNNVAPGFIRFVNDQIAAQSDNFPMFSDAFDFLGILKGSVSISMGSMGLLEDVDQIGFEVAEGDSERSVRLGTNMDGVSAFLDDFTVFLEVALLGAEITCGAGVDFGATVPRTGFGLFTEVDSAGTKVVVTAETISLSVPEFSIADVKLSGDCGANTFNEDRRNDIINLIQNKVNEFLAGAAGVANTIIARTTDNFVGLFDSLAIPLPSTIDLDLSPGRTLSISPKVSTYRTDPSPVTYVAASAGSEFEAKLSKPAHRAGSSYKKDLSAVPDIPDADAEQLINFHVSSDGINSMFESSWYLMWSNFATDPDATTSSLCNPMSTDACPFPPVRRQVGALEGILLTISSFFLLGPKTGWTFEVVAQPPRVEFQGEQSVTGIAHGSVAVRARPLFAGGDMEDVAVFDLQAALSARLPDYDSATGIFSGFALDSDLRVDDTEIDGIFGFLAGWALRGPISAAVNYAVDLSVLDGAINRALGEIPIKIPDIPLPLLDTTIKTEFAGASVRSVAGSDGTGSYMRFGSDFSVRGISENGASRQTDTRTVYDTTAYKNAKSGNYPVGGTFTTMINHPDGTSKPVTVRRTETGEVLQLLGDRWIVL